MSRPWRRKELFFNFSKEIYIFWNKSEAPQNSTVIYFLKLVSKVMDVKKLHLHRIKAIHQTV